MNITQAQISGTLLSLDRLPAGPKASAALSSQPFMQALSDAIAGTLQKFGIDPGSVTLNLGAAPPAAHTAGPIGFNALIPRDNLAIAIAPPPVVQHFYASDPVDDLYWNKQPAAVQQLREIDDYEQRQALGSKLASQGFQIDVPVMVWGWDAGKTTQLRKDFGYTWVPSALQQSVSAAPGLSGPGMTPYDPANPPAGSMQV